MRKTEEEKQQAFEQVQTLIATGMNVKEAARQVGITLSVYYRFKRDQPQSNGHLALRFEVVSEAEAQGIIASAGRFAELTEGLLRELRGLSGENALSFSVPADKKEALAIMAACKRAIKFAGLPFVLRYAKSKNKMVVVREEILGRKKEERNAELVQR